MKATNHVAGGIVFTGLFASLWNVNIISNPYYLIWISLCSLLPDIDIPTSFFGRIPLISFFSKWLSNNYGHRTITHSAVVWIAISVFSSFTEKLFFDNSIYSFLLCLAYLSHLIFDMMTKQGIMFLYPWMKNPCVVPAKPELRFRTGDFRQETMIFFSFCFMFVFMLPLLKDGFWTNYNRKFSTPKHVNSEYRKSKGLVFVDYEIKKQGQKITGSGYVIESSESKQTVLEEDRFNVIDGTKMIIIKTYPTPTDKQMKIEKKQFVNISFDSLNKILNPPYYNIEISSSLAANFNNEFKSSYKGKLINHLTVIPPLAEKAELFLRNPQIESLQNEIENIRKNYSLAVQEFEKVKSRIEVIESEIINAKFSDREFLQIELNELKKLKEPRNENDKIESFTLRIQELKKFDLLKKSQIKTPEKCSFTGFVEKVIVY